MVNYKYGKIYKITDNTTNKIYIGSTCKYYLSQRLAWHVQGYMKYLRNILGKIPLFLNLYKNSAAKFIEIYSC